MWPSSRGGSQVRPGFAQCVEGLMLGLLFAGSVCLRHVSTGVARVCATAACRLTRVTSGSSVSNAVDLHNSASGVWSTAFLMSSPRSGLAATSLGNVAIFAGGFSNNVDFFDSLTGTWSTARLSGAVSYPAAASVGNMAIFAGGARGNVPFPLRV